MQRIRPSRVILRNKVGSGTFGTIYRAQVEGLGERAVKILPSSRYVSAMQEIDILFSLRDVPQLVRADGWYETTKQIGIVMELMSSGDLRSLVKKARTSPPLPERDLQSIMRDLLCCLHGIHTKGFIYGDMKPSNIMIYNGNTSPFLRAKVVDVGCTRRIMQKNRLTGTPIYFCPDKALGSYTETSDIWAIGIILLELVSGFHPLFPSVEGLDTAMIRDRLFNLSYDNIHSLLRHNDAYVHLTPLARDFIIAALDPDSFSRPSANDLLLHPWIG